MWTFLDVFICAKICFQHGNQSYFLLSFAYCASLCDSSLFIMSVKDKKSEVFSYLKNFKGEFHARRHTISLNKWLLNTSSQLC